MCPPCPLTRKAASSSADSAPSGRHRRVPCGKGVALPRTLATSTLSSPREPIHSRGDDNAFLGHVTGARNGEGNAACAPWPPFLCSRQDERDKKISRGGRGGFLLRQWQASPRAARMPHVARQKGYCPAGIRLSATSKAGQCRCLGDQCDPRSQLVDFE